MALTPEQELQEANFRRGNRFECLRLALEHRQAGDPIELAAKFTAFVEGEPAPLSVGADNAETTNAHA